jgi:hypothetical protein
MKKLTAKQIEALRKIAAAGGTDFNFYWSKGQHRVEINGNCESALVRHGLITTRWVGGGVKAASLTDAGRAVLAGRKEAL